MFEDELAIEKAEGRGFGPLLIIFALVAIFAVGIGWVVMQARQTLKPEEAAQTINEALKAKGPAVVRFHSGHVVPSVDEKPDGPHYRLLEKAGLLTLKKTKTMAVDVALTPEGEQAVAAFPEFQKETEKDGTVGYTVPLAERKFVSVDKITKLSPTKFQVEYSWQWEPNKMGEVFDAQGPLVKAFNTWDRSQLIDKYGADFYRSGAKKVTVLIVKGDDGWEIATE